MTDRKTVIKGLECCTAPGRNCDMRCPYYDEDECEARLERDSLILLKEQEPKAIEYHDNPFTGLPVAHCPNCKRYARQFHASVEEETHYCPWCGQEVTWNV